MKSVTLRRKKKRQILSEALLNKLAQVENTRAKGFSCNEISRLEFESEKKMARFILTYSTCKRP